jgi:hypothetical protein
MLSMNSQYIGLHGLVTKRLQKKESEIRTVIAHNEIHCH